MKRNLSLVLLSFVTLLMYPVVARAQAWSGIINSTRATNWSTAGVVGGIPSGSWTQCGSTIAAGSSAANITAALASCAGQNKYVLLGPGTFNLTGTISFPSAGHVVLRGSGANSTFIVGGSSGFSACVLHSAIICALSPSGSAFGNPVGVTGWTVGYTQGSNQITVNSASGINTTDPPSIIFLEQCETGYTASSPTAACTGSAVDNGNLFICTDAYNAIGRTGCSTSGTANQNAHRGQLEMTTATKIAGSVLTLADPLIYPNWTSGQTPRIWSAQSISTVGVENLAIDNTANSASDLIQFFNAYNFWVTGCKFSHWAFWGIETFQGLHGTIQNNYFTDTTGVDSYGVRFEGAGHNLIENNIFTRSLSAVVFDGPSAGDVVAYNFAINAKLANNFMKGLFFSHDQNAYDLYEGNVTPIQWNDSNHGTTNMLTRYRNFFSGWESCANGQCGANIFDGWTNSFVDLYADRYQNNVANVLGTPGYHTSYKSSSGSLGGGDGTVVIPAGAAFSPLPTDPLVSSTSMYWGNYDVVTNAVRWCGNSSDTSWATTCGSVSEVPTGARTYPSSIPSKGDTGAGQAALPASFYLSSKPSWFGSIPWPAIGPDVSGGNVGQCSGSLNTPGQYAGVAATSSSQCTGTSLTTPAWGGHINAIPAMACYLTTMGGKPDGTGSVLAFDAIKCYGGLSSSQGPAPPTNLVIILH
jgi:hypothetical protein